MNTPEDLEAIRNLEAEGGLIFKSPIIKPAATPAEDKFESEMSRRGYTEQEKALVRSGMAYSLSMVAVIVEEITNHKQTMASGEKQS